MKKNQVVLGAIGASLAICAMAQTASAEKRNVILLISDGMGFNAMLATDYYTGSAAPYRSFPIVLGMSNYEWDGSYDPASFWADFNYQMSGATDSASAATSMYSGIKTDGGNILYDYTDTFPLAGVAEMADARNMATGAVSSVEFSHATPAAWYAHNVSRNNYAEIANEMIYNSGLDVIMGCGNPDYDNSGTATPGGQDPKYVGGWTTWAEVQAGTANGFEFCDEKTEFQALADGTFNGGTLPAKLIGCPRVYQTLQYNRAGGNEPPYVDPINADVPSLETMTKGAINILDQNPNGFFLMVEGGAVDWAGHGNKLGRQIEEQIDFNNSVQAVIDWVETYSSWNETIVIVTADHETGSLWGPTAGTFNHLVDNGPGMLPDHSWNSGSHTNTIVPFYAKGGESDMFLTLIDGNDPEAGAFYGFSGDYIDNTDLFPVMKTRLQGSCWSDIDGNGAVDVTDLLALLAAWANYGGLEDVNADGIVDVSDLLQLLADWGPCP